ncbi:E3 ubiquitin-protein ligase RNFT1 isoform X3 [Leopardus geoffroyi]|uniref:E3 ubiquitin-protein ligase RNFT1 isoform X3 n=1 Tax=Leopardus geoffroyi TaxID=46844 RepID=UPI001E265221|nr:E3 ubiquitin-protein ligase RNFT1 isoform X3 [Leopardus geoffroyi]
MQANCSQLHSPPGAAGSEDASASQCVHTRLTGEGSCLHSGDVHIQINSIPKECAENPSSRNIRSSVHSCTHGCIHSRLRSHSHNEARQSDDTATESGDHGSSSFSEFRYLFKWLHKSLPYILILGVKLVMQHITGISLGIGLLTTFMYANKSIVNQVFLRERCSKIQCAWLLVFLAGSSVLLYYTFHSQSLYYSLIFLNPTLDHSSFWEVLWIVGITDFILKFLFMGLKCLILLMPSFIMPFKSKLLDFFGHLRTFRRVLQIFFTRPSYGVAASKRQCADVDDICSVCQAEFQKPVLLICQHIFCEECITLWFNREKTCPLCRTVISDHINKWKDGATSSHLQIY